MKALAILLAAWPALSMAAFDAVPRVSRVEVLPVRSETVTTAQFLQGAHGREALVAGELRLPVGSAGKIPAVVLVHGSGGIGPNVDHWAADLNAIGVAAFILDSFSARGITSTVTDQSQLAHVAMMVDAFRALDVLANHARIDPERIAIMGFSKGAVAAVYSSSERFRRAYAPKDRMFAAHIGLYTPCYVSYRDEDKVTGKPIRLYHGLADDWVPVDPCRGYVGRLKGAGVDVALTEYPNAFHSYDTFRTAATKVPQAKTARRCAFRESDRGELLNASGAPTSTDNDPCIETGTTLEYNAAAHEATVKAVQQFLKEVFKL
jgi:dienelactone hydrolase